MSETLRDEITHAVGMLLVVGLALASLGAARRLGDVEGATPPQASARPKVAPPREAQIERVDLLTDRLDEARFEVPRLDAGISTLKGSHWRMMPAPYARASGTARKALYVLAFTVGGTEKKLDEGAKLGLGSAAELKTWNAAEASFDGREAIVAPPPGTIRFPLRVAEGARLEISPAVVGLKAGAVVFEIAARPKSGPRVLLAEHRIRANATPFWQDLRVDLAPFVGQQIELELTTRTTFVGDPPAALWGAPTIVYRGAQPVPYNVLFIVVDAMRPDVLAAWHDPERDAALARARHQPHEAWLPRLPQIAPAVDKLAERGVAFVESTSAATWTRPGTLAMLTGARSSELGLDTTPWVLPQSTVSRFYASDPPLITLLLRRRGVRTQAFVNNFFLSGYARAGIEPGFVGMVDHRHETLDTRRIVESTLPWLEQHRDERFFLFVNLNSPHGPYAPPDRCRARVPRPPEGPREDEVRRYLGEICKDDEAIGEIMAKLDALSLREKTLVIVTADHGETLSREHSVIVGPPGESWGSTRFHHANAMFEETTRIPIVLSLPGRLPEGKVVHSPAQNTDLVPTILALLGMPKPDRVRGESLLAAAEGGAADMSRPVVSEGRACRSVRVGRHRYVERDPSAQRVAREDSGPSTVVEELYDLDEDPGERRNIAREQPDKTRELREKLAEALQTSTARDARESAALAASRHVARAQPKKATLRFRFAGAGKARKVTFSLRLPPPEQGADPPTLSASLVNADPDGLRVDGLSLSATLHTASSAATGIDVEIGPPGTRVSYEVFFDDQKVPEALFFGGPFGLSSPLLASGIDSVDARLAATADRPALIDPRRDSGVFITRDPAGDLGVVSAGGQDEALGEVKQLLEMWGYAAPSSGKK